MGTWQDYQLELAPPWLQRGAGGAWLRALGDAKDEVEARFKEAVKTRLPGVCPVDALERIGGERGIDRAPLETDASYRQRVLNAWDAWQWGGTAKGVLLAIHDAGYNQGVIQLLVGSGRHHFVTPSRTYVWFGYANEVPGVMPSGRHMWSSFRIVFMNHETLGGSPFFPQGIPSSSSDEVSNLRRLVMKWKPPHARFDGFVVQGFQTDRSARTWGVAINAPSPFNMPSWGPPTTLGSDCWGNESGGPDVNTYWPGET